MPSKRQRGPNGAPPGNTRAKGNIGGGREPVYDRKIHPRRAHNLYLLHHDMTYEGLGIAFGVQEVTIRKWLSRYPEFRIALDQAKESDERVARSMSKLATGFRIKSEQVKFEKDLPCPICTEKGNLKCEHCAGTMVGRVVRIKTRKYYAPSEGAGRFILTNRHPDKWSRDPDKIVNPATGESINVDELPLELRKQLFEHMKQKQKDDKKS